MKKMTRVEKKMKRRRNFFKFLLLLVLISLGAILALKTDIFVIDKIKVTGNINMSEEDIIKASSINKGENIFKISVKSGEENIQKLPYTKEIKIKRKLPKTINIEMVERKEVIQIKNISSFAIIDKEGYILDLKDNENENLPIIVGFKIDGKAIGDNIFTDIEQDPSIDFINHGQDLGILDKMQKIDLSDKNGINIILRDNINIAFGNFDEVIYKLSLLEEVLKYIEDEEIQCTMILMNKGKNPIIVTDEKGGVK